MNNKILPPRMWANGKYLPVVSVNYETQQATSIDGEDWYCYPLKDVEWPTGIKDKNGKMVYGGDIVNLGVYWLHEVMYECGRFFLSKNGKEFNIDRLDVLYPVVWGSVRENPELAARVRGGK